MQVMNKMSTGKKALLALFGVGVIGAATVTVAAGTGGTAEFGTLYTMIDGWMSGILGKLLALTCLIIGLVMGVPKQNIMAVLIGILMAAAIAYGPGIMNTIIGAGLPILS